MPVIINELLTELPPQEARPRPAQLPGPEPVDAEDPVRNALRAAARAEWRSRRLSAE
ncbi:hypothetical protein [Mangrovicoccus sp. HB161399]|uniref:hypothetical protein n=1 Tax=Mangrovicoccus sp. HB161399 TaxID=2720392 RepID=UPI001557F089|nr:hypothetical protein [Mangrovicoccus sp. HB161399]